MSPLRFIALAGIVTLGAQTRVDAQMAGQSQNGTVGSAVIVPEPEVSVFETEEAVIQRYPDALLYKGLYLSAAGRYVEAAQAWERFLAIAPAGTNTIPVILGIEEAYGRAFPEWLAWRGLALFQSGDFWGAERVLTRYLKAVPDDRYNDSVRVLLARARDMQP